MGTFFLFLGLHILALFWPDALPDANVLCLETAELKTGLPIKAQVSKDHEKYFPLLLYGNPALIKV